MMNLAEQVPEKSNELNQSKTDFIHEFDVSFIDIASSKLTSTVLKSNETFDTFDFSRIKETLIEEDEHVTQILVVQEEITVYSVD